MFRGLGVSGFRAYEAVSLLRYLEIRAQGLGSCLVSGSGFRVEGLGFGCLLFA